MMRGRARAVDGGAQAAEGALFAKARFKMFMPEEERARGKAKVKPDRTLEKLKEAHAKADALASLFCVAEQHGYELEAGTWISLCFAVMHSIPYREQDIQGFLHGFRSAEPDGFLQGSMVSAIIGLKEMKRRVVDLRQCGPLDNLGQCNRDILTIRGDAGKRLGWGMEDGVIVLEGKAGEHLGLQMKKGAILAQDGVAADGAGHAMAGGVIIIDGFGGIKTGWGMKGGLIIVRGDAGDRAGGCMTDGLVCITGNAGDAAGECMREGNIHIYGNAGAKLGDGMRGGSIDVDGDIESLGDIRSGAVFHKGKQIAGD